MKSLKGLLAVIPLWYGLKSSESSPRFEAVFSVGVSGDVVPFEPVSNREVLWHTNRERPITIFLEWRRRRPRKRKDLIRTISQELHPREKTV